MSDEAVVDEVIRDSLRAHAVAGVTTVRDLGDRDYRTLASGACRPSPGRCVGAAATTLGGHCDFLGGAVDGNLRGGRGGAERGVDVIKVMASGGFATPGSDPLGAQFTSAELTALVDEAHRVGLPIVAHAHSLLGMQNALAAGIDGIEHFGNTAEGPRIDDDLLDEVVAGGVYVDLTTGNDRTFHALMPAPPPQVAELMARLGVTSYDAFYVSQIAMFGRLREHGVAVVTGVDSGMGPMKRHGNAWRTVGELVEGGYPLPRPSRLRHRWPRRRAHSQGRPAGWPRGTPPTSWSWTASSPRTSRC